MKHYYIERFISTKDSHGHYDESFGNEPVWWSETVKEMTEDEALSQMKKMAEDVREEACEEYEDTIKHTKHGSYYYEYYTVGYSLSSYELDEDGDITDEEGIDTIEFTCDVYTWEKYHDEKVAEYEDD